MNTFWASESTRSGWNGFSCLLCAPRQGIPKLSHFDVADCAGQDHLLALISSALVEIERVLIIRARIKSDNWSNRMRRVNLRRLFGAVALAASLAVSGVAFPTSAFAQQAGQPTTVEQPTFDQDGRRRLELGLARVARSPFSDERGAAPTESRPGTASHYE